MLTLVSAKVGKNFSANNQGQRRTADFYETPYSLTRLLLDHEVLTGSILEPAVGGGAIVKVLQEYGYTCDAYDREVGFLREQDPVDTVITNPPYSLASKFIHRAKKVAAVQFIFLLPLAYLHGKKRYDTIYRDKTYPLDTIYVFTRYPRLGDPLRADGRHRTGMMVYAWFVFRKGGRSEPIIRWLDNNFAAI